MKGKLNILFVLPEVAPFVRTGDTGVVGGGLPKVLKDMGHDVRIISPQYRSINERRYILRDVIRLQGIDVDLGDEKLQVSVKSAFLPNSKVQVYFIDYKPFFFREGLYFDPKNGREYKDNDRRFILFCKAVLETLKKLQWQPDVIHCHDWQSGLVPFFLKLIYRQDPFYSRVSSLFTVHDFSSQGDFHASAVALMGLDGKFVFSGSGLEFHDRCNFLKAGIVYSDAVNTVSQRYAEEAKKSPSIGCGMDEVLRSKGVHIHGILNGIDDTEWNPEKDAIIPSQYSAKDLGGKQANKQGLLKHFMLPFDETMPVVSITTPLVEKKGIDIVKAALDDMMRQNIVLLIQGTGNEAYQRFFTQAQKKYKKQIAVSLSWQESLSHLMMAGSDMLLMPSRIEPCGLTQLVAISYGTVPIVHATGGLADTVKPYDPATGKGNGFAFRDMNSRSLMQSVKQAIRLFEDRKAWIQLMKNGMREDLSWRAPAKKYVQLYNKCMTKKK